MQFINDQNFRSDMDELNVKFNSLFSTLKSMDDLYKDNPEYNKLKGNLLTALLKENKLNCYSYSNEQFFCGNYEGYTSYLLTWLTEESIIKNLKEYPFNTNDETLHSFLSSLSDDGIYVSNGYTYGHNDAKKIGWRTAYSEDELKLKIKEFNDKELAEKQRKKQEEEVEELRKREERERNLLKTLLEKYGTNV